jgi:hypothetical protein
MNRRTALRTVLIFSAGAALLPSCLQKDTTTIALKNISITGEQEKMLAQLSETIIPTTNFIGAAGLKAHEFTLMMVDDCYSPDKQKLFTTGLQQFDTMVAKKYGKSFAGCTLQQKNEWLTAVENKKDMPDELLQFYQTAKQHTLQAFTTSKQYMVDVRKYNMVPGPNFKGCVPLKKAIGNG